MGAVNAVGLAAENEIVAQRAPRRLLQHFDARHAVLFKQALFLGDDQRRGIGQRDEAEFDGCHFRRGRGRPSAARQQGPASKQQSRRGCRIFEKAAAG